VPPFTILHVCMGNICRSPMAERLTVLALGSDLVYSHSVGTGGWHTGDPMDGAAARQVRARGGDLGGFRARRIAGEHIDASDLILTATAEQLDSVLELRPDAADRTFVLGEFGRLLRSVDLSALPTGSGADGVHARGVALVAAVASARGSSPPRPDDDLDDPWGRGDRYFSRVADEIEETVKPLADVLRGQPARP
jgi:protein-tyrosine phosphatase